MVPWIGHRSALKSMRAFDWCVSTQWWSCSIVFPLTHAIWEYFPCSIPNLNPFVFFAMENDRWTSHGWLFFVNYHRLTCFRHPQRSNGTALARTAATGEEEGGQAHVSRETRRDPWMMGELDWFWVLEPKQKLVLCFYMLKHCSPAVV